MKRETHMEDENLNHTDVKTYMAKTVIGLRGGKSEDLDLVVVVNGIMRIACCLCRRTNTEKEVIPASHEVAVKTISTLYCSVHLL